MANIIANDLIFPELLQQEVTVKNISEMGFKLIHNIDYKNNMIEKMKFINKQIGEPGASKKIAEFVLEKNS